MTLFPEPAPEVGPDVRRVSLVRLCALIAQAASAIGKVSVEGEVHKVQRGRTGRLWFTLRDRASQISVSVPAGRQARCRAVAGERACVVGRLEWVNDWGQLQLVADEVTPVGEGAMALAVAEARIRLGADGLLGRPRLAIPRLPATIGVICGHEAAVRADIESVIAARSPGYPVAFIETTVSGPGAVDNVVHALAELDGRPEVGVIILARGGGDATQLLPFSDEALCRAVCESTTPVVAAIGHDADRPLVDEVADLRCGTPSLAAAAVVPDLRLLAGELEDLTAASRVVLGERLAVSQRALAGIDRAGAARSALTGGTDLLVRARGRLDLLHPARAWRDSHTRLARLDAGGVSRSHLAVAEARLAAAGGQAEALSPVRVLERGYAVVRRAGGAVVRDPAVVAEGERLDIEVARGRLSAVAEGGSRG
jgi:exodeoxyribonuclease VII large subunit